MKKKCKVCFKNKSFKEFHSNGYDILKDGTKKRSYKADCKDCANKKWKKRIQDLLDSLVKEWICSLCGYDKCRAALEFHHKNPHKKDFTIATRWCISRKKLERELKKCMLLCANCHRELHNNEK